MHALVESPDLEKQRAAQENFGSILSKNREISYRDFQVEHIPAQWSYRDKEPMKGKVILYCHGGGYTSGSFRYARSITNKLVKATGMDVVSFDYRLAPEHPYPAALEDAQRMWVHLTNHGYAPKDVILAGDSAGGNLVLALTLHLKEQKKSLPAGLILFSPWTDLTLSGSSMEEKEATDPILTMEYLERCVEAYVPDKDRKDPCISPVFADFHDFPPVCIQVGSNEILYSDSVRLAKELEKAGVLVKFAEFPGMWHVFQMSPLKTAREAIKQAAAFMSEICASIPPNGEKT